LNNRFDLLFNRKCGGFGLRGLERNLLNSRIHACMIRALTIFLLSGLIAVRPPYKNALTLTKIKKIFFLIFFDFFWIVLGHFGQPINPTLRMAIFFIFVRDAIPYFCKQPIDAYQGNRLRPRAWRKVRKLAY